MLARIVGLHLQTAVNENHTLENRLLKQYRAIAHKLHPIVTVGGQGLTSGIETELDRALPTTNWSRSKSALETVKHGTL